MGTPSTPRALPGCPHVHVHVHVHVYSLLDSLLSPLLAFARLRSPLLAFARLRSPSLAFSHLLQVLGEAGEEPRRWHHDEGGEGEQPDLLWQEGARAQDGRADALHAARGRAPRRGAEGAD